MKKLLLLLIILFSVSFSFAQEEELSEKEKARREKNIQAGNPFKRFGYKPKIATLSKGKYLEFHDLDSIVTIGSYSYHVKRKAITGYTKLDTVHPESTLRPEIISRWFSPDPLSDEFPSWSPYSFVYNNPVRFIDPDGRAPEDIIGSDGNAISYTQNSNGDIVWSSNTTADIKKIGNAMLTTNYGKKQFGKWMDASTKVNLKVNYKKNANAYAKTKPSKLLNSDGQYVEIDVVFYDKVIQKEINSTGKRFDGATVEEAYGANGSHEVDHNDPAQIILDKKTPTERNQDPKVNKPINSEVKFRREYHKNNPNKGKKNWEKPYKNNGYDGNN